MNTEEIIRELKHVEEQYINRPTPTFEINISCMARDCRKHIELLNEKMKKMQCCGNCKHYKQANNYLVGTCKEKYDVEGNNICDKWEWAE